MSRNSNRNFYLKFPAACVAGETERAKCFNFDGTLVWLPKSQIRHESIHQGEVSLTLPEWLVIEKGIEAYADQEWIDYGEPD